MDNIRKIRYLPCSTVCHGECEVVLVKQLQAKNHIPLNALSEKNGRRSIVINTINDYLNAHFPTKDKYLSVNKDLINHDKKRLINHKIFTIMDKDDTPDVQFEKYKSGELFKSYWWGMGDYIVPIYFCPNMDAVFEKHGFPINTSRKKPAQYLKMFTVQYDEVIDMLKTLPESESNIKLFLDYISKVKR